MPHLTSPVQRRLSNSRDELYITQVVPRSSDAAPDFFNVSQALFACLSVIIGLLALIVGLLQLRRHRKRHALHANDPVFELEANFPKVRLKYACFVSNDS
jgi:hypothetical protein